MSERTALKDVLALERAHQSQLRYSARRLFAPRNHQKGRAMTTIYVRPGEGRHYPMIDGDHIA